MIQTKELLTHKKFLPLFLTQLLGVLNDNILRSAITIFITFSLVNSPAYASFWTTIATGMFVLPTLFFSTISGDLADKYRKARILRYVKLAEILIVLITSYFLLQTTINPTALVFCIFLMGSHSAVFSPAKFSYLPEYLETDELLPANGLIESSTFVAIAIGATLGALVVVGGYGINSIVNMMLFLSITGWLTSLLIPDNEAQDPNIAVRKNFLVSTQDQIDTVAANPSIWLPIIGISWFWVIGTIHMTNLINFVQFDLHYNSWVYSFLNGVFTVGIGTGSLICNKLLKGEVNTRLVPFALLSTALFGFHLYSGSYPPGAGEELQTLTFFFTQLNSYRIIIDIFFLSVSAGIYVVPLYAILQKNSNLKECARTIAAANVVSALFMIGTTIITFFLLYTLHFSVSQLFVITAAANLVLSIYLCKILPFSTIKPIAARVLKFVMNIEVQGLEHFQTASNRLVIIANHVSFLDVVILALFLPGEYVFAVNTDIAKLWIVRLVRNFAECYEIDPTNPIRTKSIAKGILKGKPCIIFPEGRLTNTGQIMKIYAGPVAIADWADAEIMPIHLGGNLKHSVFSRLRGIYKMHLFTPVTITILPIFKLDNNQPDLNSKEKRELHVRQIYEKMVYASYIGQKRLPIYQYLLHTAKNHGMGYKIIEDFTRKELSYRSLILKSQVLGKALNDELDSESTIGVLLPNTLANVVTLFALYAYRKVPVMFNYTAGTKNMAAGCVTSNVKVLITSRQFISKAELTDELKAMRPHLSKVIFLEDLAKNISSIDKIKGLWRTLNINRYYQRHHELVPPIDSPAVILFTSGSEGMPKGVVLSHRNIIANIHQSTCVMDLTPLDSMFNALPMFHAFGFNLGTLTPLLIGVKTFLYPNPKQFANVVDLIYDTRSTLLIGTNTFLAAYLRFSNAYDFNNLRMVFAGGEKLQDETRNNWLEQRGIRLLEGYGSTECGPVISCNTNMHNKAGTVGKILPGMEIRFNPFPDTEIGGELCVRGENVMLGYLYYDNPGKIIPLPNGWYDTGDVITYDTDNFITIIDRVKRFAKISGEMISLSSIENEVAICWPEHKHGVISLKDQKRGEKLVLITEKPDADRADLARRLKNQGVSSLGIPSQVQIMKSIPLLGTGKVDYPGVMQYLKQLPKKTKGLLKKREAE